jgi:hypothetical protein
MIIEARNEKSLPYKFPAPVKDTSYDDNSAIRLINAGKSKTK